MKLLSLFSKKEILATKGEVEKIEILSLSQKSDKKTEAGLFFCINGISGDGHNYIKQAQENGCIALVVERWVDSSLPQILVRNTRNLLPIVCKRFYKNLLKNIKLIGVTGTNGKTTISNIIYQILNKDEKSAGLIGTNFIEYKDIKIASKMTTPDTVELFEILSKMVKSGVKYVVMEVSAHSIALNKLSGIKFEVGVFSNLSQDHLDFFSTMDNYADTKQRFLTKKFCKNVVINIDDEYGKKFALLTDSKLFSYGIYNPADSFAMDINLTKNGSNFLLNVMDNVFDIHSNMLCMFNVYNMLASSVCAKILKLSNYAVAEVLNNVSKIDGRLNCYYLQNNSLAVIDYAHTPDGLEKVLTSLKQITKSKIIVVFGCGGNRDKTKRPIMGDIASKIADVIVLTSDNPRNENPFDIIDQIANGIKNNKTYLKVENRKKAIEYAVNISKAGDIILIAGKGHEDYQEIQNVKHHFSDYEIIKPYIK